MYFLELNCTGLMCPRGHGFPDVPVRSCARYLNRSFFDLRAFYGTLIETAKSVGHAAMGSWLD